MELDAGIKLWLRGTEDIIGPGMIRLLSLVDETGSVRASAEKMGVSYNKAIGAIPPVEKRLGYKLTNLKVGGSRTGKRSTLTNTGRDLVRRYNAFNTSCKSRIPPAFECHFKGFVLLPPIDVDFKCTDTAHVSFKTDNPDVLINGLQPGMKLWVTIDSAVFGMGIAELFENINKTGAVRAAAEEAGMSYSKSITLIHRLEKELGHQLVRSRLGGLPTDRTRLTEAGCDLYKRYKDFVAECREMVCESFLQNFNDFKPIN